LRAKPRASPGLRGSRFRRRAPELRRNPPPRFRPDLATRFCCHVGYRSCFYRSIPTGEGEAARELHFEETEKAFDPKKVYGDAPNPTIL
jgi:hypothetical protein